MSNFAKEFLSISFAFVEFGHLMWGSTFPKIVFTDNRSVTIFFQTKMIPPALCNACEYVLQYKFVIAPVAGTMNTAADFLSRTEVDLTEKLEMTIHNDIHTKAIEVNIQSSGIVEEEEIYVLPDDESDENQLLEEKQNNRNQAQTETHNDPENAVSERQQFHKPTSGLVSCSSGYFKESKEIEEILDEFHDIFARHRFDIDINREFKVKLTPNDDRPAYRQSLPTPINLEDDNTVELALLHKYGIITTLLFSKNASPMFAQRKPNGRLRLLVDLRKINNLITEDYVNNNHPVSTLSDAAQHMAGKKLFCKLDCSQAYHCLQMADYQSI